MFFNIFIYKAAGRHKLIVTVVYKIETKMKNLYQKREKLWKYDGKNI